MKTAEEWILNWRERVDKIPELKYSESDSNEFRVYEAEYIKAIQLDAWKQGMSDASEIAEECEPSGILEIQEEISKEILKGPDYNV